MITVSGEKKMAPTTPNNQDSFEELIADETAIEDQEPAPKPPRQRFANAYYLAKAYVKEQFQELYDYVAVCVMVTWSELVHAVDVVWLWIRDYILGSIAVIIVLLFLMVKEILGYFAAGLARRLGVLPELEEEQDA